MATTSRAPIATFTVLVAVVTLAPLPAAAAAEPEDCASIADPGARLHCYDRLHGAPDSAAEPSSRSDGRQPGTSNPESAPKAADAPIVSEVVATGEGVTGRTWFRLADGQVWEQVTPRRTAIEAGTDVRIARSPIGTYHLRRADGSSRSTQVRQVE